jgi:hypothetical protein
MTYRPTSFIIQELVAPEIYKARGERAWELLNPLALMALQSVRDKFGPITVNNWHAGGSFKESGMRSFGTSTGAAYSMHRYGGAYDCKSKSATPTEMCEYILKNRHEFPYVTAIENPAATPSWMHIDSRNHNLEGIWIVNP